jgi:hypothetical protein
MRLRFGLLLLAVLAIGCACGEREVGIGGAPDETDAGTDGGTRDGESRDEGTTDDAGADGGTRDEGTTHDGGMDAGADAGIEDIGAQVCCTVTFPQAVGGAMFANPEAFGAIPVHLKVAGAADSVTVTLGETAVAAGWDPVTMTWMALVPVTSLPDGATTLAAEASRAGAAPGTASVELVIGRAGAKLTDYEQVHAASSPRVHRRGDDVFVTWADRALGRKEAWLRRIDGAGRWLGDAIALVGSEQDTLYARTAFGKNSIGVLFQRGGGQPYFNFFKMTGFSGAEIRPEMALDPEGASGNFYGDIEFDGEGFVMVWRSTDADAKSEIRWMRVPEDGGAVSGPVTVAASGDGDPVGGFEPFVFLDVATTGGLSIVGFARYRYDALLDVRIPKSQLALLDNDGTLLWSEYAGIENDWTWHRECRVFAVGGAFVAIWSATDLTDPAENPPNLFYAAKSDGSGNLDPGRGAGAVMFIAPDDRDEPFLLPHPAHLGILAWTDNRAYTLNPQVGGIRLYAAPVGEDLSVGDAAVFPHARFFAGSSELRAAGAGTNALLFWLDERHGSGVMDPRPEVWFDTTWH